MKRELSVVGWTMLGAVVGGGTWLVVYVLRLGSIGFDGPAGVLMGMTIFANGFVFGVASVVHAVKQKKARLWIALPVFVATLLIATLVVSVAIGNYALETYSTGPTEG